MFMGPQASVNEGGARIEDGVVINTASVVEHHCLIEAYIHIAPDAAVSSSASVGALTDW